MNLLPLAQSLETVLLEDQAVGDVQDFSIDIIPDDHTISINVIKKKPVKNITVELKIARFS